MRASVGSRPPCRAASAALVAMLAGARSVRPAWSGGTPPNTAFRADDATLADGVSRFYVVK